MIVDAFDESEAKLLLRQNYGYSEEQYKLSVMEKPVTKLWGTVKKKGKFKVIMLEPKAVDTCVKITEECHGSVEIHNGILSVYNPKDCRRYPSIIANDSNVEVYVNGSLRKGTIILTDKDQVKFRPKMEAPKVKIWVELSEDRMEAYLHIQKKKGKVYRLKNVGKSSSIQIESYFLEVEPNKVPFEECIKLIESYHIKGKFTLREEVERLIDSPMGGSAIVAKGIPAVEGTKTDIEYLFQENQGNTMENSSTVQIGDVLAIKLNHALPGQDGMDITGEVVKAQPVQDESLIAGSGTMLFENCRKVVATTCGRPEITGGEIRVIPILVIPGDVSKETGNILFDGDVLVKGNIQDNMKVTAKGKLKVNGSVYNSKVFASQDITIVGKAIGGNIIAGLNMFNYFFDISIMEKIILILNDLLVQTEFSTLAQTETVKDEKKQEHFHDTMKHYVNEMEKTIPFQLENDLTSIQIIIKKIKELFLNPGIDVRTDVKQLNELHNILTYYVETKKKLSNISANITVQYTQSAVIQASGNIIYTGLGSYQSSLAAREILFRRPTSSVKGGMLVAQKSIKAGTIGSPSGIHTYCRILNKDGKVYAHYYNGTVITIGDNIRVVTKEMQR